MRKERGNVSLEASLTLPFVLLAILALSMLVRYFVVYEVLQHAMYETGREMASYYYLWATTGMEDTQDAISGVAGNATRELDKMLEPFANMAEGMDSIATAYQQSANSAAAGTLTVDEAAAAALQLSKDASSLVTDFDAGVAVVTRVLDNPVAVLRYIVQSAAGGGIQGGINLGMQQVCYALMQKHIPGKDMKAFCEAVNLEGLEAATQWNQGRSGEVELLVRYAFKVPIFEGYTFPVVQRTVLKGWGLGV